MTLLEAISPTARRLLKSAIGNPQSPIIGGVSMNCIQKNTKTGQHRVHVSNANGAPVCGGGNSARKAQWQEVILEANCARCQAIINQRQAVNNSVSNINLHVHRSRGDFNTWLLDIKINGVKAHHERCERVYTSAADAITNARHAVKELAQKEPTA